MATSSSNSSASSRRDRVCKCGEKPVLTTSWTDDNPSRRFLGCRNYYEGHPCTYFRWVDDEICERGNVIIPQLRTKNLQMKEDMLKMKEKLLKLKEQNMSLMAENMKLKDDELELKVQQVETNNDNLKLMDEKRFLYSKLKMVGQREKWFHVTLVWGFMATAICLYLYIIKGYGNVCQVGLKGLPK